VPFPEENKQNGTVSLLHSLLVEHLVNRTYYINDSNGTL
jgi:hypothetical protein